MELRNLNRAGKVVSHAVRDDRLYWFSAGRASAQAHAVAARRARRAVRRLGKAVLAVESGE